VLPKSFTPSRIESNLQLIHLDKDAFNAVNDFARGKHTRLVNIKDDYGYDVWADEDARSNGAVTNT